LIKILNNNNIQSVIIEGGKKTLQTFIDENIWDEARVFTSLNKFKTGIEAPKLKLNSTISSKIINDTLKIFRNYD
jgi:diaminohydroxyphosphoribosylaminopyrimidine deaminase/5-amino-6-(5-phosphoribosylamino)uracil reductase